MLLIDEIDALIGDTLITVLRQLRAGYDERPTGSPQSVILCGVRDVRDYRIHSACEKTVITGGSAFIIKAVSMRPTAAQCTRTSSTSAALSWGGKRHRTGLVAPRIDLPRRSSR